MTSNFHCRYKKGNYIFLQGNQDNTSLTQYDISTVIFKILMYLNEVDECSRTFCIFFFSENIRFESRPYNSVVRAFATF